MARMLVLFMVGVMGCLAQKAQNAGNLKYVDRDPTVTADQFYGSCQDAVTNFDGTEQGAGMFCDCIRSGNSIKAISNSPTIATMKLHNFIPLTNRVEYPYGNQVKWASYLSMFLINSYADSPIRLVTDMYDANCTVARGAQAVAGIFEQNSGAGIMCPTCQETAKLVSSFAQYMGMASLSYGVELTELENRNTYSSFYRLSPMNTIYTAGFLPAARVFNWTTIVIIAEGGGVYEEGVGLFYKYQGPDTFKIRQLIPTTLAGFNPDIVWERVTKSRTRPIVVMANQPLAEAIVCSAFHWNISTNCTDNDEYVFVLPSWFSPGWFRKNVTVTYRVGAVTVVVNATHNQTREQMRTFSCTPEQMTRAVAYSLSLNRQFYRKNTTQEVPLTSNVAMSVDRWKELNLHMAKYCYYNGSEPRHPDKGLVETDATLLDAFLLYYNTFKTLNKTITQATPPMKVGEDQLEDYTQLDDRFNDITGQGLRGLRWLFIYLMGKTSFPGLSGYVSFWPNPQQTFLTKDIRGAESFWELVNTSFPNISASFVPSMPTRPIRAIYTQRNAEGVAVRFGALTPLGTIEELNPDALPWFTEQGCTIPNDTFPEIIRSGKSSVMCQLIPENLRESLGGCDSGTAFIISMSIIGMLCVFTAVGVVWRVWYKKKLSAKLELKYSMKTFETFEVPETISNKWEIPREKVVTNRRLGEGAFGAVYGGDIVDDSGNDDIAVAVKTLHDEATFNEKKEFLAEGQLMTKFDHSNIVKLIGFCTKEEPFYVVMELMMHGDLRGYVLAHRHLIDSGDPSELTTRRLTKMVLHVAKGLEYLAEINFVHRDIAARNCMVTINHTVKIGDFGMARATTNTDYYRVKGEVPLPVRWMAKESLFDGRFTAQSDMWSFGVVVWEVITFGAQPFPGLTNPEVIEAVREGKCLRIPDDCPDKLRSFIASCWITETGARTTAAEAVIQLQQEKEMVVSCVQRKKRKNAWKTVQTALSISDMLRPRARTISDHRLSSSDGAAQVTKSSEGVAQRAFSMVTGTKNPLYGSVIEDGEPILPARGDSVDEFDDGYMNTDLGGAGSQPDGGDAEGYVNTSLAGSLTPNGDGIDGYMNTDLS